MGIPESIRDDPSNAEGEEPPPFMGTWNRLYVVVVIYTCALVLALYLMTVVFNR